MVRSESKIRYEKNYYLVNKDKILATSKKSYLRNRNSILCRHRVEHTKRDIRELLVERAKARARVKNIPFDITKDDIIIPETCPILGIPLYRNVGGKSHSPNSYSLDKINPLLGYVKGNIWVISYKANTMKNNATREELISFAKWVLSTS